MEIVPTTLLALMAVGLLLWRGPRLGLWVVLALTPFGGAAAFNLPALGGATIAVTDIAALSLFGLLLLTPGGAARLAGTARPFQPGFWLVCLIFWCAVSAIFAPRLFAGATEVFSLSRSANSAGIVAVPLWPGTGNITQLFRLSLGLFAFLAVAAVFRRSPAAAPVLTAMTVATIVHVALGWTDVLSHAIGLPALLDVVQTANYAFLDTHRMMGFKRMVGGFPEASSFGTYSLMLFAFWLHLWVVRPETKGAGLMLALSAIVLLRSTSSATYASTVAFAALYGTLMLATHLRDRASRRGVAVSAALAIGAWLAAGGLFLAYHAVPAVRDFLDISLFNKLDSASGVERTSWNAQAWRNFLDTYGIGAGLGSVRASSWPMATLGSIGVLGTALYLAFLGSVAAAPRGADPLRAALIGALKMACLALLMVALLTKSTPDLEVPFFLLAGVLVGLSRGAALERRVDAPRRDLASARVWDGPSPASATNP
ncbi:MAG: hypothetical protein AAGB05_07315 [Pseudomonadota bacterium]